ncbi:UNVERIFIED_CONTAM: Secreted RxLR effector protein [Sesamum calycinum]|uniref:Secreted RxLR effector protein n=1 Tax=Sesamum calycinum TaxID=2727403 RepID=A0AAW2JIM0_9LAMI
MRNGLSCPRKQSPKTDEELKRMLDIPYASAVGSIQYAAQCTRPDIAYALSVTNRYQACAGEAHWTAVKTILKYLRRTKDVFLVYGGGELILEGFSDASFQSDDDDAKSQSGFVYKLNGGVVAWKSSKQDTTTDSTKEAEYIAASEAAMEAVWIKKLHQRVGRYHLFRERVGRCDVRMDRVSSAENTVDPLTKPVSQIALAQHLRKTGLRQMSDWLRPNDQTQGVWAANWMAAMKPTSVDWSGTFQVEELETGHRVSYRD